MLAPAALKCLWALLLATVVQAVISPKVVIFSFFNDERDIWLGIPEFNLLEQNVTIPGLFTQFPDIHCNGNGSVCQLTTGEGEINAAASTLALVLSPEFNLTQTYFLFAGVAGINPGVGTLASVTFAQFAVQVGLQYEVDAREKPANFSTGFIPQGATAINSYPQFIYGTEVFQLNDALRQRAIEFAKTASLNDTADAQAYRKRYPNATAQGSPNVIGCDTATSDVWWTGELIGRAFENFMTLLTNGTSTYCTTQQEDNAVLESLLRGHIARRVDFSRIILMRTASDFDRPPPGGSVTDNLFNEYFGDASILNLYLAGIKVIEGIIGGWNDTFAAGVSPQNYIGDVIGSIGGSPKYGPGSIFNGQGAPPTPDVNVTASGNLANSAHTWSTGSFSVRVILALSGWVGVWLLAV
ncbi:hypothetical protein QCA50_020262 [Cerrena zonata]|uniref:Purine nucleoside permease n=1 Tax=Cerrena zonata TaxID=2478898 RepID=A0AAW0FFA0_9APHY